MKQISVRELSLFFILNLDWTLAARDRVNILEQAKIGRALLLSSSVVLGSY